MQHSGIRELEYEDLEGVGALARLVGWAAPTLESWERLWRHNPALEAWGTPISRGWVLEDRGRVVGCLYNVPRLYRLDDRTLRTAVASSLVVEPEHRGKALQLVVAYAKQSGVDLLLNTTAAPEASKVFEFLKFQRIPQPDYDVSYYWVLREGPFLQAAFRKKGFARTTARLAGVALAPLLWGEIRIRHRLPRLPAIRETIAVLSADELGKEVDDLWERKLAEGRKLLAFRSSRMLRWQFLRPGHANPPVLIGAHDGKRLRGYVALVRQDAPHLGLKRARVADLFVEGDDRAMTLRLLGAAARQARSAGVAMMELVGYPPGIRAIARECRPRELQDRTWPFLFKTPDPELQRALNDPALWHASLFDGDGSL